MIFLKRPNHKTSHMKKPLLFTLSLLLLSCALTAQKNREIDSLKKLLTRPMADTTRISISYNIADRYRGNQVDSSIYYCGKVFDLADQMKQPLLKMQAMNVMAINYCTTGDIDKGREFFQRYLELALTAGNTSAIGYAYGNIGITYNSEGIHKKSLEYYLQGLPYMEKAGNKEGIANISGNIGNTYMQLKNRKKAIEYLDKSIDYYRSLGDSSGLVTNYINLATIYSTEKKHEVALNYIERALKITKAEENYRTYATTLMEKAGIYLDLERFNDMLPLLRDSKELLTEQKDEENVAHVLELMGWAYYGLKDYKNAESILRDGISLARKTNALTAEASCFDALKACYKAQGNYKLAFGMQDTLIMLRDTLFNSQSTEQVAQMQTLYETEKKEQENKLLQEKNEGAERTIKQQKYIGAAIGLICLLLIAFAVFIVRANRQKQRINQQLEQKNSLIEKQKKEVEEQKLLVEDKQKEILDSIYYARRIQRSLLGSEKHLEKNLQRLQKK
jgi:tetratricopeptide (TPR) repeat protein